MNYFDFSEALSFIKTGFTVCLDTDKHREYKLKEDKIICNVGDAEYTVTKFYTDAVMSNDWYLKK